MTPLEFIRKWKTVAAAYCWPEDISTEEALAKLLELNLARSSTKVETDA